ncbi:Mg2+ and Co2+ transporter CorA [Acetoanaerobium pronyense]|uniref:Mg2+ and Co2+ transporter CorA n=1 Tax=Acetoanaerobium pronyense TaxID=1482736 RepID=A0ABS4KJP8_9FIRM|nr:hypothetical protein [Acetoanaerobium pronyense]MBP2027441.1 Mg2+ and Co2+ transporter CorA [Acetoanaerobium pronyense]
MELTTQEIIDKRKSLNSEIEDISSKIMDNMKILNEAKANGEPLDETIQSVVVELRDRLAAKERELEDFIKEHGYVPDLVEMLEAQILKAKRYEEMYRRLTGVLDDLKAVNDSVKEIESLAMGSHSHLISLKSSLHTDIFNLEQWLLVFPEFNPDILAQKLENELKKRLEEAKIIENKRKLKEKLLNS